MFRPSPISKGTFKVMGCPSYHTEKRIVTIDAYKKEIMNDTEDSYEPLRYELCGYEQGSIPLEIGNGVNVDLINFNFSLLSHSLEFTYIFREPYLVSFNFFDPW